MYRKCLEVNPEHSYALYNLAVMREEHTKGGDFSEVWAICLSVDAHILTWKAF